MAIEEVRLQWTRVTNPRSYPPPRNSVLRYPTRKPMPSTAVSAETQLLNQSEITNLVVTVNQAVDYILSQPDGEPANLL